MYLVVGGSKGIGLECVTALINEGNSVIATYCSTNPTFMSDRLTWQKCDLSEASLIDQFCKYLDVDRLDGIVLNAGDNLIKPLNLYTNTEVNLLFQINLLCHFQIIRQLLPLLSAGINPSIVGVSSIWGSLGLRERTLYAATKGGMEAMYRALADELSPDILVNTVAPGFTATDLTFRSLGPEGVSHLSNQIPLSRLANPAEVASLISYLVGPKNTYITGQCVKVDGGFTSSARCL